MLTITVRGDAKTQGSKRLVGRGVMVESAKGLPDWREAVRHEAVLVWGDRPPVDGPVVVQIMVTRQRPKAHYRAGGSLRPGLPLWPIGRTSGDVDKLARAILDALTAAGVWGDDAQVALLTVGKRWCGEGEAPAALITVRAERAA